MCGFLIYENRPTEATLGKHLRCNKHRGVDGFGIIGVQSGRTAKALTLEEFLTIFKHFEDDEGGYIIHHRKASIGGVTEALVHPLEWSDEQSSVALMQNGTRTELSELFHAASDSAALAELWHGVSDELLQLILHKCGVVFAHEGDRLFFHKDEERSLYYSEAHQMYASAPVETGEWHPIYETALLKLPKLCQQWDLLRYRVEFWKVIGTGRCFKNGIPPKVHMVAQPTLGQYL